jgi:hypothetical protein
VSAIGRKRTQWLVTRHDYFVPLAEEGAPFLGRH